MMSAISKRRNSDEAGFTLVELLVVIAILGILAAVAVFAIGGTTKKSKSAACKSDVAVVQTASDAYAAQDASGAFAPDQAALVKAQLLRAAVTKTVAADGYAVIYTAGTGLVTSNPADCAIA